MNGPYPDGSSRAGTFRRSGRQPALAGGACLWGARPFPFAPCAHDFGESPTGTSTEQLRARLIASCVLFALISVPLILRLVPPNGVYGFRIRATQVSRPVWYSANALMGWAQLIAAVVSATSLIVFPMNARRWLLWAAFLVPLFTAIVASLAYVSQLH